MSQAQKGVCAEPNLHAQYLMFNVIQEDMSVVRELLAKVLDRFDYYDSEHYEAMVSGLVAVGNGFWDELYPEKVPVFLGPFPDMQHEERSAPVVPADLFVQIRADRFDISYALGIEICSLLGSHAELVEQVQGFRFLDGRDLNGFVEGGENPKGMAKLDTALVGDDDPDFAGGSYLHVQRFRHLGLRDFIRHSSAEQEAIMGRDRDDNKLLDDSRLKASSHARRVQVLDERAQPLSLLNQSMPYGNMRQQGLYFVSCASNPKAFTERLRSMIHGDGDGDGDGHYDHWLDYTTAETGAAFFAPSVDFIRTNAG